MSACTKTAAPPAPSKTAKAGDKKPGRPKPPFDMPRVYSEPNERSFIDPQDKLATSIFHGIKPGHWTGVLVQTRANHADFSGELSSQPFNSRQQPLVLERSFFSLATARPVAFPLDQSKTVETVFFSPPSGLRITSWMGNRLNSTSSGENWTAQAELMPHLPRFQYFMCVLTRDPNRYKFLRVLDSVRPPAALLPVNLDDALYYRVVIPRLDLHQPLALPSHPLCWSNTAYLIWDDVLPSALSPEQQQALVDWLHWGGGIIISGPQTLDTLRGSFLEPYLPAVAANATTLESAALTQLNDAWTVADPTGDRSPLQLRHPWSGVELGLRAGSQFVSGTGSLVAQRRVGRGRVVATAFRLTEPELLQWHSFDSFVNACLLGRPAREFNASLAQFDFLEANGDPGTDRYDPELVTQVRYFTRDAHRPNEMQHSTDLQSIEIANTIAPGGVMPEDEQVPHDDFGLAKTAAGTAGWNDFSAASNAARSILREAAGITVPRRDFVLWMLGAYLLVVVPANWLVFRLLGHVEWAWLAVPLIALGWGGVVVWQAQLDIGFSRAQTEVDILEIQADYSRAHLTRYAALYSSLSTNYDLQFDGPSAVAQPFSPGVELLRGQAEATVTWEGVGQNALVDYPVRSNSTGMVHSEEMFDLGGGLAWQEIDDRSARVENHTSLAISGVVILRRQGDPQQPRDQMAWIGTLLSGASATVQFEPFNADRLGQMREDTAITAAARKEGTLSIRPLIAFAEEIITFAPGDVRLIGWREDNLPGLQIEPSVHQRRQATLVVGNLRFGQVVPLAPDRVLRGASDVNLPVEAAP